LVTFCVKTKSNKYILFLIIINDL